MREIYKIVNDPVHGFIQIPSGLLSKIFEHPWIERLRGIKQLGLTHLVYPGATHSRFSHALGSMHLMREAIVTLRLKGESISPQEEEASMAAMLLHDIGHSPFSHSLEYNLIPGLSHEELSLSLMESLNREFKGELDRAISIFKGNYPKQFLHQLVSSQLDSDRLDYLVRDSFFSGVVEGMFGLERIIKMVTISQGNLAVEIKGIHSVEKFLIARRMMYWQVYLHKTVVAANQLLRSIIRRAVDLAQEGVALGCGEPLCYLLTNRGEAPKSVDYRAQSYFLQLDDSDLFSAIKGWQLSPDPTLALLSKMLVTRNLPKIELFNTPPTKEIVEQKREMAIESLSKEGVRDIESSYLISEGEIGNVGYDSREGEISIAVGAGEKRDLFSLSDTISFDSFSQMTNKYFLCTLLPKKSRWNTEYNI
ncbi:MAG: HD domain-containing protein [Bacteroidales bacterium]